MKRLILVLLACFMRGTSQAAELTRELDGTEIIYSYADGSRYNVQYTAAGVKYRFLTGKAPGEWWGPFPYKAIKTPNGEYFLGWYEKGYGDQITHLVNLETKTLYGSGIIVKKDRVIEHFQAAKIEEIKRSARLNQ